MSAEDMSKNNTRKQTTISKAKSVDEIADYWDTHSLDDHWEETSEVDFEVRAQRHHRITIDPDVYVKIEEQARTRGVLPETLINLWLVERLQKAESSPSS